VSNQDKQIKVTDKRMFTAEGELREEYRFLADAEASPAPEPTPPPPPPPPEEPVPLELPDAAPGAGATFYDLAAMLAEPASIYLGDVPLPDGQSAENLEMAQLHIELIDVLRQKTTGNLTVQENAFLEDLLYRLRVRYVQKTR
jgi:uncharacterized protein DUF1844